MTRPPRAFTLVELLVVVAIIVILLALLMAGLDKAFAAANRSKCASMQRSLAQMCRLYAADNYHNLPRRSADTGPGPHAAMDLRGDTTVYVTEQYNNGVWVQVPNPNAPQGTEAQLMGAAVGLGHLVRTRHLPSAKLADAVTCPSLDTSSAMPQKFGMDEIYTDTNNPSSPSNLNLAGPSYFMDPAHRQRRILSSYNYRAMSYANTNAGAMIMANKVGSNFALTTDMVTALSAAGARNYGRKYHHETGWNVSFADAHVDWIVATASANKVPGGSRIETDILGDGTAITIEMNGRVNSSKDEEVYKEFGRGTGAGQPQS